MSVRLRELGEMNRREFTERLGGVFEHSPWVAEEAWASRPFASLDELHDAMMAAVRNASDDKVLALIRAHPDLATRLGIASLTAFSAKEQQGAGLDRLTPEEFETFSALNKAYTEKFGFPFIFAVRGKGKDYILAAMKERVYRKPEEERREALAQIGRIARFRLQDLIAE
jgi:2-oxo-4-hydroxy-4-carboxy-5-ureidoimidazoline decarboxylase